MDDMTAFESQVAREALREAGPSRGVDVASIVRAARTASRPGRSSITTRRLWGRVTPVQTEGGFDMYAALKIVAAAAIVALFGGFLLAGVLTTQQGDELVPAAVTESPSLMTTEELLSTMVTEEVEPGVQQVLNDGVRDLTRAGAVDIVAGYDDGIWLLREDEFLRVGSDGSHAWTTASGPHDHTFEVAPDGTMWVIPNVDTREGPALRSTDGEQWTVQPCPEGSMSCRGLTIAPDGSVWASWAASNGTQRVSHLGPTGWELLDGELPDGAFDRFYFTDAGGVYGSGCDPAWFCWLQRYEDGVWQNHRQSRNVVAVGPDGTTWDDGGIGIWGNDDPTILDPPEGLVRLAAGEYANWTSDDLPEIRFGFDADAEFEVAPDGSLWFSLWRSADGAGLVDHDGYSAAMDEPVMCDGLARFDGQTLDRYLSGRCISLDITADGAAWVLAGDEEARGLYVITPE